MTFRLPFQISRARALCRHTNPDGLVSKLVGRKGNLKKQILHQIKKIRSTKLLQECKHKTTYVPIRYHNTTKSDFEYLVKPNPPQKSVQGDKSKLVALECGAKDYYYQKMDETNFGPYSNQGQTQARTKMMFSARCNKQAHATLPKYDYYGMENYYNKIKDIDEQMSTTIPSTSPPKRDIKNILPDTELKIQNDIWKQSGSEILNNLNSKNSIWRYIYGKRQTLKHDLWEDFFTSKMFTKFVQAPATQTEINSNTVQLGTKHYPHIYMSTKRKTEKLNLDNTTNKVLSSVSRLQPRLLYKPKKCKDSTERKADLEEGKKSENEEYLKDITQTSVCGENNEIPDILETKNSITDCKPKISHLPVKINSSKIFVRHQSKSSKIRVQHKVFIKEDEHFFFKPNVIMATVCNRILNNPSPEFMEAYSYNNSLYHINAMKDIKNFNSFKYPKICYNAENDTYLLYNELVAKGLILSESKTALKRWKSTDKALVPIKPPTPKKIIKAISAGKLNVKPIEKEKPLKTTNEPITKHRSFNSANLEKLNEAVSDKKLEKVETPLSKKKDQKVRNKIKSTKIPKTLGEIYGAGKIPFLVEVSKSGQSKHKQYLVVIQLPGNKNQESPENNTNSPLPLTFNTDLNNDYYEETLLCPHPDMINFYKTKTIPDQILSSNKQLPNVGSMIGLVKVKNKILPLLEINDKRFEPLLPTKLSHIMQPNINKKGNDTEWAQKTYTPFRLNEQKSNNVEDQSRVVASLNPSDKSSNRFKLQRIMNTSEYMINQQKPKGPVLGNHMRQYSTLSRRHEQKYNNVEDQSRVVASLSPSDKSSDRFKLRRIMNTEYMINQQKPKGPVLGNHMRQYNTLSRRHEQKYNNVEDQSRVVASFNPSDKSSDRFKLQGIMNTSKYMINQQKPKGPVLGNHMRQYSTLSRRHEQKPNNVEDPLRVAASLSPSDKSSDRFKLQRIMNSSEYMINQQKPKGPMLGNHMRQYSTLSRRHQTTNALNFKIFPQAHNKNRTFEFQQKCNLSCCLTCPYCGQYPCKCSCPCSPCGWYPCYSCRPQCCPKFKLDHCCPRGRWDCSIPIPPCQKIDSPYPSYGESMPMWCKEPTECFDYDQHILQPKNQVSPKIHLMEESIPKVTVVDPALDRKCCRDKWCEPCPPCIDQRICFDCPYKIPVDYCCPRGRPHCYCWPERPCSRKPPPYRCFSDEDLEFPEVEVTEHDLARRFASDLYRRMGKKCALPFAPVCTVDCDLRSGEPKPVYKYDPKEACSTTCLPPGTYPATCTMQRVPPCEIPGCDTCINCCMPLEGIKKTRCSKRCCPQDCCGYCPKEVPECPKNNED